MTTGNGHNLDEATAARLRNVQQKAREVQAAGGPGKPTMLDLMARRAKLSGKASTDHADSLSVPSTALCPTPSALCPTDDGTEDPEILKIQKIQKDIEEHERGDQRKSADAPDVSKNHSVEEAEEQTPQEIAGRKLEHLIAHGGEWLPLAVHVLGCLWIEMQRRSDSSMDEWRILFEFIRHLKLHPELTNSSAAKVWRIVDKIIGAWSPKGTDAWEQWLEVGREDAAAALVALWDKIHLLPGQSPIDYALQQARERPINFGPEQLTLETPGYVLFLTMAGWLQVHARESAIMLPTRKVGAALDVGRMTISRWCQQAVADGFLVLVEPAHKKALKAARYRFAVERVPMFVELLPKPANSDGQEGEQ